MVKRSNKHAVVSLYTLLKFIAFVLFSIGVPHASVQETARGRWIGLLRLVIPSGNDIICKLCHDVRANFALRSQLAGKAEAMLSLDRIEVFA